MDPARRRAPAPERSLLWRVNAALARPVASLFLLLGFTAGQLSFQSLTVTLVGLLRMASGDWGHVVQGALVVYGGLLLDRADHLVAQAKGRPPAWGTFLGLLVDRRVEVGLLLGLAALLVLGIDGGPDAWRPLSTRWALVACGGALAALLTWRLAAAYSDVLALRTHLLVARRLPGPSPVLRRPAATPFFTRWVDRDLLVVVWAGGLALGQLQATALAWLGLSFLGLCESIALFWRRRRDPEPHANRVLTQDLG
jgi:hypothetical protein